MRVNVHFVYTLFGNIQGLAIYDNPRDELANYSPGHVDNDHFRAMLRKYVVPYVLAMEDFWLERAKLALRYVLTFERDKAAFRYSGFDTTLVGPEPADLMYVWLWEDAFPGESWELPKDETYEVYLDADETNSVLLKWGSKIPNPLTDSEFRVSNVDPDRFYLYAGGD
jgi:hypothetical protein